MPCLSNFDIGERLSKTASTTGTTLYLSGDVELALASNVWTKYLDPDAKQVGSVITWLHADHLASIRLFTDATGAQSQRANYLVV